MGNLILMKLISLVILFLNLILNFNRKHHRKLKKLKLKLKGKKGHKAHLHMEIKKTKEGEEQDVTCLSKDVEDYVILLSKEGEERQKRGELDHKSHTGHTMRKWYGGIANAACADKPKFKSHLELPGGV